MDGRFPNKNTARTAVFYRTAFCFAVISGSSIGVVLSYAQAARDQSNILNSRLEVFKANQMTAHLRQALIERNLCFFCRVWWSHDINDISWTLLLEGL